MSPAVPQPPYADGTPQRPRWPVWVVVLAALGAYANTIPDDFTLDDIHLIQTNPFVRGLGNIPRIFATNYWGFDDRLPDKRLYRPLTVTTYALNYAVHEYWTPGYHAVNVALHALVCALLYAWLLTLFEQPFIAFVAALLFAVHPVHTEAVAGVVGRAELLALAFILLTAMAYDAARSAAAAGRQRWRLWAVAAALAYWASLMSKEGGIVAPAVVLAGELLSPKRRWLLARDRRSFVAWAGFVIVTVVHLTIRALVTTGNYGHLGYALAAPMTRFWTALRVCGEYVVLFVVPWRLQADYWTSDVPLAGGPFDPGVILALLLFAGGIGLLIWSWRRLPAAAWGLLIFAVTMLPVSNFLFPTGVMKAERILYAPSAGFLAVVAALLSLLVAKPRWRRPVWVGIIVVSSAYFVRTVVRNLDWRDNDTLARVTVMQSPDSPAFNAMMAQFLRKSGDDEKAREHLLRIQRAKPDAEAAQMLGEIEFDAGRCQNAIPFFEDALKIDPTFKPAMIKLARCCFLLQRWPQAAAALEQLRTVLPDEPASHMNLVAVYLNLQRPDAALVVASEAVHRFPDLAEAHAAYADALEAAGKPEEARVARQRASELPPTPPTAPP